MLSAPMRTVLLLLLALAASGCVREPYRRPEPVRFTPGGPAGLVFPSLIQHAAAIGYAIDGVDPARGVFAVHSRMLGRPSRRARYDRSGPLRSNLFLVQVQEGQVLVTAIGRHVAEDGTMHPTLAQELEIFGDSMRRAARAVTRAAGAGGGMPAPPSAYGGAASSAPGAMPPAYGAPGAAPPSAYGAPPAPPPGAYGAPPAAPPATYGGPVPAQPPSAYGAPPTAQPPPSYEPAPPGAPRAAPQPAPEPDVSPARRLGTP